MPELRHTLRMRYWRPALLALMTIGACGQTPSRTSGTIVISNLKANVLGTSLEVCGTGAGLSMTQFTFDFTAQGIDIATGATVNRLQSSTFTGNGEVVSQVSACSTGPCTPVRRACITAGRSAGTGTIEFVATEDYKRESTWTIELRHDGQTVRSNPLTLTVNYPAR